MPRGGKRPGAGRKKGSATKRTRKVADQAAEQGVTPLEVMLQAMREHHAAQRLDLAAEIARHAAPYIHPRLASVQHGGTVGVQLEIVEEVVDADDPPDRPAARRPGRVPA